MASLSGEDWRYPLALEFRCFHFVVCALNSLGLQICLPCILFSLIKMKLLILLKEAAKGVKHLLLLWHRVSENTLWIIVIGVEFICLTSLQVLDMINDPHYLYRMTILHAISLIAPVLGPEITCSRLLPLVTDAAKDRWKLRIPHYLILIFFGGVANEC